MSTRTLRVVRVYGDKNGFMTIHETDQEIEALNVRLGAERTYDGNKYIVVYADTDDVEYEDTLMKIGMGPP